MLKDILNGLVTKQVAWKVTKTISLKELFTILPLPHNGTFEDIYSVKAFRGTWEAVLKEEREKGKQVIDTSRIRILYKSNGTDKTVYIPLAFNSEYKDNQELDKDSIEVYVLSKEGEEDIYRVK